MEDEYFDALRRTGDAWEAYSDAAKRDRGEGTSAESKRCEALWAEFQRWVAKLTAMRESRRGR
jgi:hypothetical protein